MKNFEYTIKDEHGIHARPATIIFKEAKKFNSKIMVGKGDKELEFKGLMSIMSLGVKQGETVKFSFEGDDEEEACNAIFDLIKANL